MSQEIGDRGRGAKFGFRGGMLEVVLSKAFEDGPDDVDMGSWVWVEDYDVVEFGGHPIEAHDALINDFNEAAARGAATLRHDEPLKNLVGVQKAVKWMVSLSIMIWWNEDKRSKKVKMCPLPRESKTSSTRGMGSWASELIALIFL